MTKAAQANRELTRDGVVISLSNDAYDYNNVQFTLEVAEVPPSPGDDVDTDADISGLPINATEDVIRLYLESAMASVQTQLAQGKSLRHTAVTASNAGYAAVESYLP